MLLQWKKLLEILCSKVKAPERTASDVPEEESMDTQNQALALLLLNVQDSFLAVLITGKNSGVVWKKLSSLFAISSSARVDALQSERHENVMLADEGIQEYGYRIHDIRNLLVVVGEEVTKNELLTEF